MTSNPDQVTQTFRCRSTNQVLNIPVQPDPRTNHQIILWRDVQNGFNNAECIRSGEDLVPFLKENDQELLPLRIAYQPGEELEVILKEGTDIQQLVEDQTEQLQAELERSRQLTEQLDILQQRQQQANENTILQLQYETLNSLAHMQSLMVSVLAQAYELHEYPIPRLFIVLPKAGDRVTNHIAEHFRLYFLCECGTHTMPEGGKIQHEVHLANHEGYDLDMPTEFFKRYCSYLLIMMSMIKYGITGAGTSVPPLTSAKITTGLIATPRQLEHTRNNIIQLVDSTIKFLDDINPAKDSTAFKDLEDLEGVDPRQLEFQLKGKVHGRCLGNLYRIVTPNGHVKWVCQDHYKAYYRDPQIGYLKKVFNGALDEQIGRIEIAVYSNDKAKKFYDAMIKARGVQELRVTLGWNATMDHVKALAKAVTQASLVRLEIDGRSLTGTGLTLDVINRGRRFDPILQLASKGHIQSLRLINFEKFFSRVKSASFVPSPKLREFSLDSEVRFDEKSKTLENLYDHYTGLAMLELRLHDDYPLTKVANDILSKLHNIESFTIKYGRFDVTSSVSQGTIHNVDLTIAGFDSLTSDDHKFIRDREFTQLNVQFIEKEYNRRTRSRIHDQGERCITVIVTKTLELQSPVAFATSEAFGELKSSINCGRLSLTSNISRGDIKDMAMVIDGVKDLNSNDVDFIRQGRLTSLTVRYTPREAEEHRLVTILQNSPSLTYLGIGCEGIRAPAIITLVLSAREQMSSLSTFELMEEKLTPFDLHGECDNSTHIQTHVSFKDSAILKMQTWIRLRNSMVPDSKSLLDFIRQYGWSIVFWEENRAHDNTFAAALDSISIPDGRILQLETLGFEGSSITADGYVQLKSIIKRSPEFKELGLRMKVADETQFTMLKEYGSKISKLLLHGTATRHWLPKIAGLFPTRASLPNLTSFGLWLGPDCPIPSDWIAAMVSVPPQAPTPSSNQQNASRRSLRTIVLRDVMLEHKEWKSVIESMDFTELQHLDLRFSNLSRDSFDLLVNRIPAYGVSKAPLRVVNLDNTNLLNGTGTNALGSMLAELQEKAPMVQTLKAETELETVARTMQRRI
ncbi:hypothetical protein B0O80DRAFT_465134 [Mortierella sp. GBAus27b]|nr:hypothetical protein B0O80DRAFT_465134 [Mortierella sp. GBAus27b]